MKATENSIPLFLHLLVILLFAGVFNLLLNWKSLIAYSVLIHC